MFYGEYLHSLDDKGRVIIPSKFRDPIIEADSPLLFLTRGLDECLFAFPEREWRTQENNFKSMPYTKKVHRNFQRLFFAGASPVKPDKQWRIVVPDYLREYAGLSKEIMVAGVSNRIEIWDKKKWQDFYSGSKESYEEMAEGLIGL